MVDIKEKGRMNREKLAELMKKRREQASTGEIKDQSIPKAEEKEYYPMSSVQKRTYLISQMDPGSVVYNLAQNNRIIGEVCPEKIKEAVQKLIDRHEI